MQKSFIFIAFIMLGVLSKGLAQEILQLSFHDAIDLGLKNNITVLKTKNELKTLSAIQKQSYLAFLPDISANISASRQEGQQFQLLEDGFEISDVRAERLSGTIGSSINLFDGFRKVNQLQIANLNKKAQLHSITRSEQELVFNLGQQYLQILLDEELLNIAQENIKNQKEQLKRVEGFVEAGIRPRADFFSQQSNLKQLELEYIQAENNLDIDKANFSQTLQLAPFTELKILPLAIENELLLKAEISLRDLYELALTNRKDFKALQSRTVATKKSIAVARSGYFPSLDAFYNYGTQYSSLNDLPFKDQLWDLYPNNTMGLSLNIPIFSNYTNKVSTVRARVTHENRQLDKRELERSIFQDVQNAYLNYKAAKKSYQVSASVVSAAKEAYTIQEERYNEGLGNISELAIENQNYIRALSNQEQAKYTLLFQNIILEYQTGTLNINNL